MVARGLLLLVVMVAAAAAVTTALAVPAHAQEIDHSTYVESVQVLVDRVSGTVSASVLHQSTSTGDIVLPDSLEERILEHDRLIAIIFTNADTCVPGVVDEACIVINMARVPGETNIILVQDGARAVGDLFIDEVNEVMGMSAAFHSVFVHHDDTQNEALGVLYPVMGRNTVSAVYTVPQQDALPSYHGISSRMLAGGIAEGGGFVDAARALAAQQGSTVTFLAAPLSIDTLMQLKVTRTYNHTIQEVLDPLELLGVDGVKKSAYFDDGFYPLSSLIRVAIVSPEPASVSGARADILPMRQSGSTLVPEDVSGAGWVLDPGAGELIRGTYLLGGAGEVLRGETEITLGGAPDGPGETPGSQDPPGAPAVDVAVSPDSIIVVGVIVAAGGAAAIFYLRGYYGRRS